MFAAVVVCLAAAAPVIDEVKDADGVPGVRAEFDVDADPDALLQLLWDVGRFKLIFPDIKTLTVTSKPDDNTVVVDFGVNAIVKDVHYVLRRVIDREARTIRWVSIGGDLNKIVGHWLISARPGGSRVVYQSIVDVGLLPGATSIYRSMVMGKMNEIVGRVQRAAAALPKAPPKDPASP